MGDISPHFLRKEFACKCGCGFCSVDKELNEVLEEVREKFGPVVLTNACRCLEHNRAIGSEDDSQHVRGLAADGWAKYGSPEQVIYWLDNKYPDRYGMGIYDEFFHIDVKPGKKRRWDNRGQHENKNHHHSSIKHTNSR